MHVDHDCGPHSARACHKVARAGFGRSLSICSVSFEMHVPGRSLWHLLKRSASRTLSLCSLLEIVIIKPFCYRVS